MTEKKTQQKKEKPTIWIKAPSKTCEDPKCPFHGKLKIHGRTFVGKVIKNVFHKTVTIEFGRQFSIPKYERYEKRRTRIKAYVPPCIDVTNGDTLKIAETRPLSKTKNFVAVEVMDK